MFRRRRSNKPNRNRPAPLLARLAHYMATMLPVVIVLAGLSWMALDRSGAPYGGAHAEQTLPHPPVPTIHPRRKTQSAGTTAPTTPAKKLVDAAPVPNDSSNKGPSSGPSPASAVPASAAAGPNSAAPDQSASTDTNAASAATPPAAAAASAAKTIAATTAPSLPPLPTRKPKPKPPTTPEGIFLAAMDKLLAPALAQQPSAADISAIKSAMGAYKRSKLQTAKSTRDKITDPAARKLVDWYALRVGFGRPETFYTFLKNNPAWPARKTMIKRAEEQLFATGGSAASIKSYFKSQPAQTGAGFAAMASAALAQNNKPQARMFATKAWHELSLASSLETGFIKRFGKLLTIADHRWRIDRLLVNDSRWRRTRRSRAAKVRRLIPLLPSKFEQQKVKARLAIYLRQRGAAKLLAAVDKGPPPPPAAKANSKTSSKSNSKSKTGKPETKKAAAKASAQAQAQAKKVADKATAANPDLQKSAATAKSAPPPLPTRAARSKPTSKPSSALAPKPVPASVPAPKLATAPQIAAKPKTLPKPQPLDWGLQFQRVQLLRRQKKREQAWKILLKVPGDKTKLVNPDAWWQIKQKAVYSALRAGNISVAAKLAAKPGPISVNPRKDAAFMAGWIAYRHLKDYKKAAAHFRVMRESADGPLSASKAAFWLARAAKHYDKTAASTALEDAASFNHTFHGQLARQMIDPALKDLPIKPPVLPTSAEAKRFAQMDVIQALILAHKAGLKRSTLRAFFNSLRYHLRAEPDVLMLAHLARRMDDIQMSLRIGKTGVARKLNLYYYSYPTHALPLYNPLRPPPEPAFLLGIARQETEFNTKLKSSAGARGILQVMPITARHVCSDYKIKCSIAQLVSEPAFNTMIGSAYIGDRLRDFRGSYVLTLSGYNAGPGRTRQWIRQFGDPRAANVDVVDWIERIPFTETRKYVMKVLSNIQIYRARLGDQSGALQIRNDLMRAKAGTGKPE